MSRHVVVIIRFVATAAVLAVAAVGGLLLLHDGVGRDVARVSAFPAEDMRPPATPTDDLTLLLLGQDWSPDAARHGRSDAILLVRIPWHRSTVTIVSIPRDSWVTLPGLGEGKINSALALGGPPLAVATVEDLTGIRVDHVAMVDGDGFSALTDALGGVTIEIPETVHDSARGITWTAGTHRLDGAGALDYVGQRYGLAGGDLDRVRRHQNLLRAMATTLLDLDALADPRAVHRLVGAATDSIVVDEEWDADEMRELALSLRYLKEADLTFTTAPVAGLDRVGGQSVVRLDRARAAELWTAIREDWGPEWVEQSGVALAPRVP
ncbi:LCP family protein [Dietzia sp. E1]|uniref:LCP family glycopolymer transferase n=1 Tax=Dietzia sp. E1 TaxID=328361 RepID=UPI0015F92A80|nr:LCP family protein [Dietzia sp. E1]